MFSSLSKLATKRPYFVVVVAAVVAIAALLYGGSVSRELNTWGFDDPGSEYFKALDTYHEAGGFDPTGEVIALIETDAPVTGARGRALVRRSERILRADPSLEAIRSPFGANGDRALIARDGHAAIVVGYLKPAEINGEASDELLQQFKDLRDDGITLGGGAITRKVVSNTVEEDLRTAELIAFPLLFFFALIVFRGLIAALIPLGVGLVAIPFSYSVMRFFDQFSELSVFALNLVTGLGIGLAIDYSLLMVTRFREELENGADPRAAIGRTVATAGRTVFFSALTVAGAAASLLIFPQTYLYSMGVGGITVALTSALVALVILPAILALIGRRIDSFSFARRNANDSYDSWLRLGRGVMRRPVLIALVTSAALLVMASPSLGIKFISVDASVLPENYGARDVQNAAEKRFGDDAMVAPAFALVKAPPGDPGVARAYGKRVADDPAVDHVGDPVYLGEGIWRIDAFPDGTRFSDAAQDTVHHMRDVRGGDAVMVSGISAWFVDQADSVKEHLPLLLLIIGSITFIVLFMMTGSVVLPLKTFFLNLCTLGATFGLLVWVFQEGRFESLLDYDSQGALEITQPVILFAIAFGLATDYGVFLLSRIKELHDAGHDNDEAVARGLAHTGRIVTSAALLFCIAMVTFAISRIAFIKGTGIGTALAVAIDATLVRALLVPSLMTLLGDYNWWAPRPLRRFHERFGWSDSGAASLGDELPGATAIVTPGASGGDDGPAEGDGFAGPATVGGSAQHVE